MRFHAHYLHNNTEHTTLEMIIWRKRRGLAKNRQIEGYLLLLVVKSVFHLLIKYGQLNEARGRKINLQGQLTCMILLILDVLRSWNI